MIVYSFVVVFEGYNNYQIGFYDNLPRVPALPNIRLPAPHIHEGYNNYQIGFYDNLPRVPALPNNRLPAPHIQYGCPCYGRVGGRNRPSQNLHEGTQVSTLQQ